MRESDLTKPTIRMRSASWVFGSQVISLAASFPMSVLLARVLGASGKGTLSVVQLIALFTAVAFSFGIGQAMVYYSAKREVRGRDAVVVVYVIGLGASIFLALASMIIGAKLADLLNVATSGLVLAGLVLTGPALIGQALGAYLFGSGAIRATSVVNTTSVYAQLIAVGALALTGLLTPASAIAVWAAAVIGAAAVFTALAWRTQTEPLPLGPLEIIRRIWRYSIVSWPGAILGTAAQRLDLFMLAALKSPAEVGIYSIAVTFAELCLYVPNALGATLAPKVASERDQGLSATLRTARVAWFSTALIGLAMLAAGWLLIPFVFGREFQGAVRALAFILPGIVAWAIAGATTAYLTGAGKPAYNTIAAGLNTVVNVAANLILIPRLGAAGAALSSTISYCASAAAATWFFTHNTGVPASELLALHKEDLTAVASTIREVLRRWR